MFKLIQDIQELKAQYETVVPLLEASLSREEQYSADDVLIDIISGDRQLWLNYTDDDVNGAVVTRIVQYPESRKMLIHLCSGKDITDWMQEGLNKIEDVAVQNKCSAIELKGRKGWKKLLTDFQEKSIILEKKV